MFGYDLVVDVGDQAMDVFFEIGAGIADALFPGLFRRCGRHGKSPHSNLSMGRALWIGAEIATAVPRW